MFSINNIFEVLNNGNLHTMNYNLPSDEDLNFSNYNLLPAISNCHQRGSMSSVPKQGPRYHKEHPPYCHCCANHDVQVRLKGHKNCPFQSCECPKCEIVKRRRRLMAEQIKERRRQRKLAKEAAKALKNNTVDLPTNQDIDFAALCFVPEEPFNVPEMNPQLILDALHFSNVMPCLLQAAIPMTDPNLQIAGRNPSDIGSSSVVTPKFANNYFTTTSDELHPYYCHFCANHDGQSCIKGHKKCPFKLCKCPKCKTVKQIRRLMNEQIKQKRRQRKMEKDAAKTAQNNEPIKERRRQRKLAKEAAKALENNTVDLPTKQDFDFSAVSFIPEDPFNVPEMNPKLILDTLQLDSGSIEMAMTDPTLQFAGINSPDIGFSSIAASISPNDSIAETSNEMNISALALLESLRMASLGFYNFGLLGTKPRTQRNQKKENTGSAPPTFSIPPPLNLCALQSGISYSSMDVPVSHTMPLPMFTPNETFTYSNSEFSLPNTFLQQIQQSFFNDFLSSS
ncbi:DM DNA binding domain-containing protein [Ditylenchus destructor]|uniref:DM DNA binding domain-containing protein n=1 Tax=Ditylenchus destructor TaxID=166010 RepID=A0AAD4QSB4_9BILA|nr:DM DNA binding domain-containing protein [Ditylenchus destructor]